METVQEAIFAGLTEVSINCTTCRLLCPRNLAALPGVLGNDLIADLHKRLVCKRCGNRPAAEDVKLKAPLKLWDGTTAYLPTPPREGQEDAKAPPAPANRRWKTRHRRMI